MDPIFWYVLIAVIIILGGYVVIGVTLEQTRQTSSGLKQRVEELEERIEKLEQDK